MDKKAIKKIKEIRIEKNINIEDIANSIGLSSNAYRKIEMNYTQLTVKRLYEIAKILDVDVSEILDINVNETYNQEIKENSTGFQKVENYYHENIAAHEKHIQTLKDEIVFLRDMLKK